MHALLASQIVREEEELQAAAALITQQLPEDETRRGGGSLPGKLANRPRRFQDAYETFLSHYFAADPLYSEAMFRRRYRISREMFQMIARDLPMYSRQFTRRRNALQQLGIHPWMKVGACLRLLATGDEYDSVDQYYQISESVSDETLLEFCKGIFHLYQNENSTTMSTADRMRYLDVNELRGFPGCLGSLDCMHWEWRGCPVAWQGQYRKGNDHPSIILEGIATHDLKIWHRFFGCPGSSNDLNVLDISPLVRQILTGTLPEVSYQIGTEQFTTPYFLVDGIYPNWSVMIDSYSEVTAAINPRLRVFKAAQEAVRKDVERAFGVLQDRFHILAKPGRMWSTEKMAVMIEACIILHNMIITERLTNEGEIPVHLRVRDNAPDWVEDDCENVDGSRNTAVVPTLTHLPCVRRVNIGNGNYIAQMAENYERVVDTTHYYALKDALVDNLWHIHNINNSVSRDRDGV